MKRYRRTNVFAVFCALTSVFLILYGCGGGGGDGGSGGGSGSTPGTTFDAGTVKAQGMIASIGGVVEVKDSISPANGTKITFSKDCLAAQETIQIVHHSQYPALPSGMIANGPVITLSRSGIELFNKAVVVELPVTQKDVKQAGEYMDVLTYDEELKEWGRVQSWYAYETGKMVLLPRHFSKFIPVIRKYQGISETWTTLNMDIDTMEFENTVPPGVCAGMAMLTQWYFGNQGHGLKCYYNSATGYNIANEINQDRISFWPALFGAPEMLLTLDHRSTVYSLMKSLKIGQPAALAMLGAGPHAVVVFAWISTSTDNEEGYFLAYDVNDHDKPIRIYVQKRSGISGYLQPIVMFVENNLGYKLFGTFYGWYHQQRSSLPTIFTKYPSDDVCVTNPAVKGTWNWKYKWLGQQEGQATLRLLRSGIWLNEDIESANGKWTANGKQLVLRFADPTFEYHNTWTGVLNATNDNVHGIMVQTRASTGQENATGNFQGTQTLK